MRKNRSKQIETTPRLLRVLSAILILFVVSMGFGMLADVACAQQLQSHSPADSNAEASEDLFDMDLEELLSIDIRTGKPGWWGTQLEQLGFKPYIHGYAVADYRTFDLNRGNKTVDSFDLHYFNLIFGTDVGERIAAEVCLEYEHGGDEMGIRYGIIDYKIAKPAILRFGKFLVPMGKFNEYFTPEYANKLPDRPYCLWRIVPTVWPEVGVQFRGEYELTSEQSINYALYVVNGLEQPAGDGGNIRDMRANNRDTNNSSKAYGGRIGFKPTKELEIGASYYTGVYTIDGQQNLSIMDLDAEYKRKELTLRGEYVWAIQETSVGDLDKNGFYAEAAYRLDRHFEPVVRYDQAFMDNGSGHDIKRSTIGLIIYPEPKLHPMFTFKISQSFVHDDGTGEQANEFIAQCVIGF